jgi:4-amino-4-deoxy-L-arabinose transferase-like glycosyltransferase
VVGPRTWDILDISGVTARNCPYGGAYENDSMNITKHLLWAALITALVNAAAMLSPVINSGDALTYATLAQHMVISHDWARLTLDGQDWLDKPHFPFWITALSFKLGGVSAFTYILPGFIFHLIGAYYTYRMAKLFYDASTAVLAVLIYLSIFNLMDSAIEIKAEAYLRGQIMAACYYWLRYDAQLRVKYLLPGALFTAMAVLTKGIFTLFTIASGFFCLWLYQRQWAKLFSLKWLAALILSLLFVAPELSALHLQFDHPTIGSGPEPAVSGFKFFLWDSQFGRVFNTGPIQNLHGDPLYFVRVFLYGFVPWTIVFIVAMKTHFKAFGRASASERAAFVFLIASFACTFLLFSATRFQMSYYIDIVLPFAAILCAHFLSNSTVGRPLFIGQMCLLFLLAFLVIALGIYVDNSTLLATVALIGICLSCFIYATRAESLNYRAIIYSVLVTNMAYIFLTSLTALTFTRYGLAYNAARLLGARSAVPIYIYRMPEVARELALYTSAQCHQLENTGPLIPIKGTYYLVVRHTETQELHLDAAQFRLLAAMKLAVHKSGTFDRLLSFARGTGPLETIDFIQFHAP